jgi:hypothetical protein
VQVSRLGMPLVNEVVIGLKDKDKFNASKPWRRRPVHRLRHPPHLPALLEIALALPNTRTDQLPAHRPGDHLPHRHQGREPAQGGGRRRCCA